MAQMSSTDKVSKKAEPDTEIAHPADGNRIYKVLNTFTDARGQRWQTDQNFVCDDTAELKMRLDKGEIRADGEPPHSMVMGQGEWPDPNWEKARDAALERGELPPPPPPHLSQQQAEQNQQPRSTPDKSRA